MQSRVITAHGPQPLTARVAEEERYQATLVAIAAVDAGDVVEDAVVAAWIDSLDVGDAPQR